MCRMWRFIWSNSTPETAHAHPQWGEATQVHRMRLRIFTSKSSEKSHQNAYLGKAKSMRMVRLLFNHKIQSFQASAHPQWGEATQMHTMQLCILKSRPSKSSHKNTFLRKNKSMQMVRLLFNHKIRSYQTSAHPQWRKATSL